MAAIQPSMQPRKNRSGWSPWRRIALAMWRNPSSPQVIGFDEVDMTEMILFVNQLRQQTGTGITLTHVMAKAVTRMLELHPDLNLTIRWGRPVVRSSIDVFVLVAVPPRDRGDLSGVKIARAEEKAIVEIAKETSVRTRAMRRGEDRDLNRTKKALARLPRFLLRPVLKAITRLTYDLGIGLPALGLRLDPFGSVIISNLSDFGVHTGFSPLVPLSRTPIIFVLGRVEDRPIVRDGKIVIRPIMRITGTFDHRLLDGFQIAMLCRTLKGILENPWPLERSSL